MKHHALLFSMLILFVLAISPATGQTIYVSENGNDSNDGLSLEKPLKTLQKAVDLARQKEIAEINLQGTIRIEKPLMITPGDWSIKFTSLPGQIATIDGGRAITGWKRGQETSSGNVWTAEIPDVKTGKWSFRQLFVDGGKVTRARIPNEGFHRVAGFPEGTSKTVNYHTDCKTFEYAEGDIDPNWHNLSDVEVIVYHFWTDSHLPIASVDPEKRFVTFQHKAGKVFTDDFTEEGARYIVENVLEGLDLPGEWYLDKKSGTISLMLDKGQDPNQMEIVAPFAPALVVMQGDPIKRELVEDISFNNLNFRHTNFELPRGNSNDRQGSASVTAAIQMTGAHDCWFTHCRFENLGGWAFDINDGCSDCCVQLCEFTHIGAGAVRMDGGTDTEHPALRTRSNEIQCNRIRHYGDEFPSAVGILLMNTSNNTVLANEIAYGYYTGVSVGWVWGYGRSAAWSNCISLNHIHHIGQGLLSDMGGIYTLGVSPGTRLVGNVIHDVDANQYGGWGIYHDEGSSYILVQSNIVYNTKFAAFNIHFAKEVTVRNNIFALGRLEQLSRSRVEPHKSVYFENNIVYWKEGELLAKNWKDKPYTYHFHPKNESGTREVTSTFDFDRNLYFNPSKKLEEVDFNGRTFAEWQAEGKDKNSRYADPMFVDPENGDFTLKPDSPAIEMGVEPLDRMSQMRIDSLMRSNGGTGTQVEEK